MKSLSLAFLLIVMSCKTSQSPSNEVKDVGQSVSSACTSQDPSPDAERMAQAVEQYYQVFNGFIPGGQVANNSRGTTVSITKEGKIFLICTFGYADNENGVPVTQSTLFPVGSGTKGFTGMATLRLFEEGKIGHPDQVPVKQYLYDLELAYPQLASELTLADLMTHRTGMIPHNSLFYLTTLNRQEIYERLRYLKTIKDWTDPPVGFRQRGDYHYNNIAFMIAGKALAAASGRDRWEDVVQDYLLNPIGMAETRFLADRVDSSVEQNVATGYTWNQAQGNGLYLEPIRHSNPGLIATGASAALMMNAVDAAKWLQFLSTEGEIDGQRLMSRETFNIGLQDYQTYKGGNKGTGFGWVIFDQSYPQGSENKVRHIYHWGIIEGYSMQFNFVPSQKLGVAVMNNQAGDRAFVFNMIHNIYRALWDGQQIPEAELFYDDPGEGNYDELDPNNVGEWSIDTANDEGQLVNMKDLCSFADVNGRNALGGSGIDGDYYHPAYGKLEVRGNEICFHKQTWPILPWSWEKTPYYQDLNVKFVSLPVQLESVKLPVPACFSTDGTVGRPSKIKIVFESPYLPVAFVAEEIFERNYGFPVSAMEWPVHN